MKKLLVISAIVIFLFGFGGIADILAGSRSGGGSFSGGGGSKSSSFSGSRSGGGSGFSSGHSGSRSGSSGSSYSGSRSGGGITSGTRSGSIVSGTRTGGVSSTTRSGHKGSSWNYSKVPGGLPSGQKYVYRETIPTYVPSYRYYSGPGFMEWYLWWYLLFGPHNYLDHPKGTRDPKSDEIEMHRVQKQVVEKQEKAEEVPIKKEPGACSQTND